MNCSQCGSEACECLTTHASAPKPRKINRSLLTDTASFQDFPDVRGIHHLLFNALLIVGVFQPMWNPPRVYERVRFEDSWNRFATSIGMKAQFGSADSLEETPVLLTNSGDSYVGSSGYLYVTLQASSSVIGAVTQGATGTITATNGAFGSMPWSMQVEGR